MSEWGRLEEMPAGRPEQVWGEQEARRPCGSLKAEAKATGELDVREDSVQESGPGSERRKG